MELNNLIEILNRFARENTFFSILILAVAGNLLTEIFRKILYYIATSSKKIATETGKGISKWNRHNIESLIKSYKMDILKVEKVKYKSQDIYFDLVQDLYHCLTLFFIMVILYLIVLKLDNPGFFYGLIGASARSLFSIFAITYYNNSLFENAKNFEEYRQKKERKIIQLESILRK